MRLRHFPSLFEQYDPGRPEQAEFSHQRAVVLVIDGDVDLQQAHLLHLRFDLGCSTSCPALAAPSNSNKPQVNSSRPRVLPM
jgi:hypothetical protein